MSDQRVSTRRLDFANELRPADRVSTERAVTDFEAHLRDVDTERGRELAAARRDYLADLHATIGTDGLATLRVAIDRERAAERERWQPPIGLRHDHQAAARASAERVDHVLASLGSSGESLRRLASDYDQRRLEIMSREDGHPVNGYSLERNLQKWLDLSDLHRSPLPWGVIGPVDDPDDPHRWSVYRAPFFGFLFRFWSQATDDFSIERDMFLAPASGWVGHRVTTGSWGGLFSDVAQAQADAQVAFAFTPPIAGLLEVVIDAQSTDAEHAVDIQDRFWASNASALQRNFLSATIFSSAGTDQQVAIMSESPVYSGGDDVSVRNRPLSRLQHYFADIVSTQPVRANESVIVAVGTRSLDLVGAHCMDIQTVSDFRWFISSVEVRVVP